MILTNFVRFILMFVLTLAPQVEAAVAAETSPIGQRIVGGLSHGGRFWLWSAEGGLVSLRPGDSKLAVAYAVGVKGLAESADAVLALRATGTAGDYVVTRISEGSTNDGPALSVPGDETPIGFFTAGGTPYVLACQHLFRADNAAWSSVTLAGRLCPAPGGRASLAVIGRSLFVGFNAGEWGGGLRRVDLDSGAVAEVAANGPVTSVIPDPEHSGCAMFSVGLAHFMTMGEIDRACGATVTTVLKRPRRSPDRVGDESEPFFALTSVRGRIWASGLADLVSLSGEGPSERPAPVLHAIDGVAMSFDASGLIVVQTDLNAAHSVSGPTLLLFAAPNRD